MPGGRRGVEQLKAQLPPKSLVSVEIRRMHGDFTPNKYMAPNGRDHNSIRAPLSRARNARAAAADAGSHAKQTTGVSLPTRRVKHSCIRRRVSLDSMPLQGCDDGGVCLAEQ